MANEASLREGEKRERLSKDSREGNDKQVKSLLSSLKEDTDRRIMEKISK